jgi:hypothetical protein
MGHKGIREFSGDESSNLFLGQRGFKIIGGDGGPITAVAGAGDHTDVEYWVAIKAIDDGGTGNAVIEARTLAGAQGDDLTSASNQTYNDGSNTLVLGNGDIVYGCFDKIYVTDEDWVIAYIGK